MKVLKFVEDKLIYLLLTIIAGLIGFLLVYYGINSHDGLSQSSSNNPSSNNPSIAAICIAIGTSIIAASIVAFLDLFRHLSIAGLLGKVHNLINEGGVQGVYQKRDLDKYDALMHALETDMDVCGYSLGAFFDSYSEVLRAKAAKNVRFRILLVNPDSEFSKSRAVVEGRRPEAFHDKINTLVNFFRGVNGVEIKFLDAPLSTMIFRIGDVMFVGPHFYRRQSKATLTFELKRGHWVYDEYQSEFDRMWSGATVITHE